ncbi:MAG TPA: TldD/PmbA family protein [Bacillota bacterium]|nr:TldD/PmbA family protein [Bacillota bacterium]
MEKTLRLDVYDSVVERMRKIGQESGIGYILRMQDKKETLININNQRTEEISTNSLRGMGIQVFTKEGFSGFASSDQISEENVELLFNRAYALAKKSAEAGGEANQALFQLSPNRQRLIPDLHHPYGSISLGEAERILTEINQLLIKVDPRLSVRTIHRAVDEEWRIARHDGTDTIFCTPRAFVYNIFTAQDGSETATTYANVPASDLSVLVEPVYRQRIEKRSMKSARLAIDLLTAGKVKSGHYKMVIDYALAKGLAHEAFGHAAETDGMESSILGKDGRVRVGDKVAAANVNIIDGPLEGDYAYQPISANGIERRTVKIVEKGILRAGLADLFSADAAGVAITGADRIESFHHLPIARMSNIRIEVEDPLPIKGEFEDISPVDLYHYLQQYHLVEPGEKVLYLTGFQGGQVNPAFGDFVFNCSGIYELGEPPKLYRAAIFSGKVLSALHSVKAGLGPLKIDAMGTCGKMFQGVPSSGGSHYFLVLDANDDITIGGEA